MGTTGAKMESVFNESMMTPLSAIVRSDCRVCHGTIQDIFSLGDLYVSTFPSRPGDNIGHAPLTLAQCGECTLVQLRHSFPQELLWARKYWYRSRTNPVIVEDLREIAREGARRRPPKEGDVWLEIGANDGALLEHVSGFYRIGVEPAQNLQDELRASCDLAIPDFWRAEVLPEKFHKRVSVVSAVGMFYDMEDPGQFVRDVARVLAPDGIMVAQLMTASPMIMNADVGNICHEHLEYYSWPSLVRLFEDNGMEIFEVERNGINGGSYRLWARHKDKGSIQFNEPALDWNGFFERIADNKALTVAYLKNQAEHGAKIYWYGASTKSNTIAQWYGLDSTIITAAADVNPEKIGRFMVGTDIPIISEEIAMREANIFVVGPYGFRSHFIHRCSDWLKSGGRLVFTTPKFEVVTYGQK